MVAVADDHSCGGLHVLLFKENWHVSTNKVSWRPQRYCLELNVHEVDPRRSKDP